MPLIKTNSGLNWNYESSGTGEPIFFIHGFAGSLGLWREQIHHFKDGYNVVAVDLPGHGRTPWQPMDLNQMVRELKSLWEKLELTQVNVVASSFAGLLALKLFRLCPERFQRISFVGALPRFCRGDGYPAGLDIPKIRKLKQQLKADYNGMLDIFFRSIFSQNDREAPGFAGIKALRAAEPLPNPEALGVYLDILEKEDLRDLLAALPYRVQFINGTEDFICPVEVVRWLEDTVPHGRFDYLEKTGHLPYLTRPVEYNQLLEDFLTA